MRERYFRRSNGQWRVRYALVGYSGLSAVATFIVLSLMPVFSGVVPGSDPIDIAQNSALVRGQSEDGGAASTDIPQLSDNRSISVVVPQPPIIPQTKPPVPMETVLNLFRDSDGQAMRQMGVAAAQLASATLFSGEQATTPLSPEKSPRSSEAQGKNLTIAAGDTLSTLLVRAGLSEDDTDRAIRAIRPHLRSSDLRPGQMLSLELSTPDAPYQFHKLSLAVDPVRSVEVKRGWGGLMTAAMIEKPLKNEMGAHIAIVKSSLYGSAVAAGIPNGVVSEAIKVLGHQIDFQRDIHPGDKLEVMYDRSVTPDGYVAKTGNLLYARLYANHREIAIYRHDFKDGRVDYFDSKGNSVRKTLLRTPMDGARLTSGFGMRVHPIMGYTKMHKGVDFGASAGTPIYAAGDGIVEKSGWFGAYGNYVRLKHNSKLSTAYAHMSRYGAGIKNGARVRQGQVIGYVGSTGRSTGPHLHYEVLANGQQINPRSLKLPNTVMLEGKDLTAFKARVDRINREFRDRANGIRMASVDQTILE